MDATPLVERVDAGFVCAMTAPLFRFLFPVFTSAPNPRLTVVTLTPHRNLRRLTAAGVELRCILRDSFPLVEQTHLRLGCQRSDGVTEWRAFASGTLQTVKHFSFSLPCISYLKARLQSSFVKASTNYSIVD